ncbi:MAG: hypothetical protein J0L57_16810, partial [Burkholderiales bacterium]|nr:hypothetical protein [Burkholderiales bacterium]
MSTRSPLPRILAAPDPVDPELQPLLNEPFASAWAEPDAAAAASPARGRLLDRVAASKAASAAMFTSRPGRLPAAAPAAGVSLRCLYAAPGGGPRRPGEPLRASLVELQPGAAWTGPDDAHDREWLVLRGRVRLGAEALAECDYHAAPAGVPAAPVASDEGKVDDQFRTSEP